MELISELFFMVILAIGIISYIFTKKESTNDKNKINFEEQKEFERKKNIIEKVENFLSNATYLEHIGYLNKEKIYKYISNNGKTYEFFDFMTENNQKIGIDENLLCFKKMIYKRKNELVDIIN